MVKYLFLVLSLITLIWLSSCSRNEDKRATYPDCLQPATPSPLPTATLFPSRQRYFTENWPNATPLVFETIELRNVDLPPWDNPESGLLILTSEVDIAEAQQYISPAATQCLEGLDFNTHLSLLVFYGERGYVYEGFKIMSLFQQDNEIIIVARKGLDTIDGPTRPAFSSPYHLISMSKSTSWQGEGTFGLYFLHHDQAALRMSHNF